MHLYVEERNSIPKEEANRVLVSHGFHKEAKIQDFSLRGNSVYLHVKRSRWIDKNTKEIVQRDYNLVAQGTCMTAEFAAFFKRNWPILRLATATPLQGFIMLTVKNYCANKVVII